MTFPHITGDRWFKQLFEASPDPTWIICGNRFVACNDAAVRTLGYASREALLDLHPSRLSPARQPDGTDSFDKAERMMATATAQGLHRFEWTHTRADGTDFIAEVTLSALDLDGTPAIYCVWRDISDRKAAEAQLRLAASVMANTSEGVTVTDANGVIISVNPAFTTITGYRADEVVGQRSSLLKSDHHDAAFYRAMWQSLVDKGRWEGEIWNRRKNGEMYPEWLNINRIPAGEGEPTRYVAVFHDITDQHRHAERIRYLAFHDALTGLPNRALFQDRLNHAIERARRETERLAVIFIDLDGFKGINDSLGHDIGDNLLQEIAQRIRARLRRGADTVARLGGDEFVVLMEDLHEPENCAALAEAIIADISQPMTLDGHQAQLSASLGVAFYPEDGDDTLELMKRADAAMYSAKAAGKATYRFFQASMLEDISRRMTLETELRQAIENRKLTLYYQPKIRTTDDQLTGVEALVRWPHAERGMIMPTDFIPIAEESGLIVALGGWVLEEACRQAAEWHAAGQPISIAVNVSARQLAKGQRLDRIDALLARHGLPGTALQIEVTESAFMSDPEVAIYTLSRLRRLGVTIAVDDFGTGFSSLSRLSALPIDLVKIDRSFVWNADRQDKDVQVVKTVIALAEALGLDVVAEGVESARQVDILKASGCAVCQGYFFARPQSAEMLMRWIRERSGD